MSRWTNYLIIAGGVLAGGVLALIGASESLDTDGSPCTPSSQTHVVQGDGAAALYMTSVHPDCTVRVVLVEADIRSVNPFPETTRVATPVATQTGENPCPSTSLPTSRPARGS